MMTEMYSVGFEENLVGPYMLVWLSKHEISLELGYHKFCMSV